MKMLMGQWFSDILGLEMVNYGWQCSFSNALFFGHFWSFDRTYEGLKPRCRAIRCRIRHRFDRTYEELKPVTDARLNSGHRESRMQQ